LRQGSWVSIPADDSLKSEVGINQFGNLVDGIGRTVNTGSDTDRFNENSVIELSDFIEKKAEGIVDRTPVRKPLMTGTKSIDSLIPVGRGQRELIIGDRQTGKTSLCIDAILNYTNLNNSLLQRGELNLAALRRILWFVYCAIGQKQATVNNISNLLKTERASWFTCMVTATAAETAVLQFLAPYTACTIGEYIRDIVGGDCVVIFDDLSKHAVAYRQMSLLLRRPPGREAYPGDVFYIHSRLLERAGSLSCREYYSGELQSSQNIIRGTMTALPIIETQGGDVSAYIPTNVISITDGQIFLETDLFYRGVIPAVNVGLSVSRVGSAAQPVLIKTLSGSLKFVLAQYREVENFVKFGAELDDTMQRLLFKGENIVEVLKQDLHKPLSMFYQALHLFLSLGNPATFLKKIDEKYINRTGTLISNQRISWLELLRFNSNFSAADVQKLLDNVRVFLGESFIEEIIMNKSSDYLNFELFRKNPICIFDDFFKLFVLDRVSDICIDHLEKDENEVYDSDLDIKDLHAIICQQGITADNVLFLENENLDKSYFLERKIEMYKLQNSSNIYDELSLETARIKLDNIVDLRSSDSTDYDYLDVTESINYNEKNVDFNYNLSRPFDFIMTKIAYNFILRKPTFYDTGEVGFVVHNKINNFIDIYSLVNVKNILKRSRRRYMKYLLMRRYILRLFKLYRK